MVGLLGVLRRVQEPERADDGAGLAGRCRYAVARGPEPRREDLGRHDEGGAVGPEVCEEEGEPVEDDEAGVVGRLGPVLVRHPEREHEHGHHEEAHDLDPEPAHDVDEADGEPVARDGAAERDQRLGARDAVHLLDGVHGPRRRYPPDLGEDVLLEEVLAVEGDVQQEPRAAGGQQVEAMAPEELRREEAPCVGADHLALHLLILFLDLLLEHLGHVGRGLLRVAGDERRVPRRLGHLHAPVVGERGRDGAEHEDDAPDIVGLRDERRLGVHEVGRGRERVPERRRDGERHDGAEEDAEPLHGEHGGDEGAAGLLVGVLGHDGGAQRVVAADAEAEPEAEEAERGDDALGRMPEREAGRDGAEHHEDEGEAVDALAAELVAEPAEEELSRQRAAEGDAGHGGRHVGREAAGVLGGGVGVVDAAEELGHERDTEQIVCVGEEPHAGDDDRHEMVPLCLGLVECGQHVELASRHCVSRALPSPMLLARRLNLPLC
uniref:Phosphate transporter protein9 n=1 Tax=Zea mays TaxID=4577 RepID=A0A804LDS5_MAIZE